MEIGMKIFLFVTIIFSVIHSTNVYSMTEDESFLQAINDGNVNYIFLKRGHDKSISPLPIKKIFCIFAVLDKAFGGNGLIDKRSTFWKADISDDPELLSMYEKQEVRDDILSNLIDQTMKILDQKKWTIVVFSEHFFSSNSLDSFAVNEIIKCCSILTGKYKRLIICINFLQKYNFLFHLYDRVYSPPSRSYLFAPPLPPSLNPVEADCCIISKKEEVKAQLLSETNRYNHFRFSNYSLVIWNGVPVSIYRKTVYHTEQDDLASIGYGFDFGNWKSHPTIELSTASQEHKNFAKLFNAQEPLIAIRICADMLYTPSLSKKTKLLIVQANGLPPGDIWKSIDIPTPCTCCVVDTSEFGMFIANYEQLKTKNYKTCNLQHNTFLSLEKELSCETCSIVERSHD